MTIEYRTIQLRGGTAGQWAAANPVLLDREIGVEEAASPSASPRLKIGDGVTAWNALKYVDQDALGKYVAKVGDTMTGSLVVSPVAQDAKITMDADSGKTAGFFLQRNGLNRWNVSINTDAEPGSNQGSNLDIVRYDDAGNAMGIVLRWYRDSGVADFPGGINLGVRPAAGADNIQVPDTAWVRDRIEEIRLAPVTASLDFPSIAANGVASLTMAYPGAVLGDVVSLGAPSNISANVVWCGFVSAADQVTVRCHNYGTIASDSAAGTWKALILR